jgi:hypothetical protein
VQLSVLNVSRRQVCDFARVIPEIDIWRAATLVLKRYGEKALEQSATRADELAADGDHERAATWRRIAAAVAELANTTPTGPLHRSEPSRNDSAASAGFIIENRFFQE